VNGQAVDPEPFMAEQGVTLGVAAPVMESVAPGDAPDGAQAGDAAGN
jgi:hypothetical protein